MVFRTKTSKKTMEIFETIGASEHLQPFALAKISIALAIKNKYKYDGKNADILGLELNRQTITGDYDLLFKKLIEMNEGRAITEEEYFPNCLKAYLDEGAKMLEQEHKYSNDFYIHLMELEKGI